MTNIPLQRPRWTIVWTATDESEAQRTKGWLERKGFSVRVQSVIVANQSQDEIQKQIKIFVPSSDFKKAQSVLREQRTKDNLRRFNGGRLLPALNLGSSQNYTLIAIAILVIITMLLRR